MLNQAPYLAAHIVNDLCVGVRDIDQENLMNFMLVVRKLYRNNPYHNFEHAFNFMHCMYNILKRNLHMFSPMEVKLNVPSFFGNLTNIRYFQIKALLISSICHDIDHGGCTNNFLLITNDVVYQLYNDSPWENHHYNVTVRLLQVNIFSKTRSFNLTI